MAQNTPAKGDTAARHDKARDLAERALEQLDKGHEAQADRLIEESKKIDPSAAKELVDDLDEDAGSDPAAAGRAKPG
jgi:hypothetical protein